MLCFKVKKRKVKFSKVYFERITKIGVISTIGLKQQFKNSGNNRQLKGIRKCSNNQQFKRYSFQKIGVQLYNRIIIYNLLLYISHLHKDMKLYKFAKTGNFQFSNAGKTFSRSRNYI